MTPQHVLQRLPQRIVCLTEETTETLYLLGQEHRIVGISGYTVRPPQARKEKPKIAAFTTANIPRILELEPNLVVGFSDLQADLAAELIRQGVSVHIFNQRSVEGILDMIAVLGSLVGAWEQAERLIHQLQAHLETVKAWSRQLAQRPRIYFEEWDDPLISGIRWVSELIQLAGGEDCFPELAGHPNARERIIADPEEVVRRAPDIIIGSWCGKKFSPQRVRSRPGWEKIPAVQHGHLYEIKSADILQPGPAALTDGLKALQRIIARWAGI